MPSTSWVMTEQWGQEVGPKGGGRRAANWEVWALQSCQVTPTCTHPGGLWGWQD